MVLILLTTTVGVLSYRVYAQDREIRTLQRTVTGGNLNKYPKDPPCRFEVSDLKYGPQRSGRIEGLGEGECVSACVHMKVIDPLINGVTVLKDPGKKGCWCERNMTKIVKTYKSCFLPPQRNSTRQDRYVDR